MAVNSIGAQGCTIQSLQDCINEILNGAGGYPGLLQIYGPGLNVNPNSPDGQMVNIYALGKEDTLQQLQNIYDSFDPDQATGVALDARCAINGVQREAGTYTVQAVSVTTSGAVVLPGLDLYTALEAFTVQDGQGNQYQLTTTTTFVSAGTQSLVFQAALLGAVSSAPGTITVPVTILPNVISVNNPSGPSTVGTNEETDPVLRIRRQNSVALPARGWLPGLVAGLLDITGITDAVVLENNTSETNAYGIPPNTIWPIVSTDSSDVGLVESEVANVIDIYRTAGCGMKGSSTVVVDQISGPALTIAFDFAVPQLLWFKATITEITGNADASFITNSIASQFENAYDINQPADSSAIVAYIKQIAPNVAVSLEGVSTDGVIYTTLVTPGTVQRQFTIAGSSYVTIST
jgi:hypothetical protein